MQALDTFSLAILIKIYKNIFFQGESSYVRVKEDLEGRDSRSRSRSRSRSKSRSRGSPTYSPVRGSGGAARSRSRSKSKSKSKSRSRSRSWIIWGLTEYYEQIRYKKDNKMGILKEQTIFLCFVCSSDFLFLSKRYFFSLL